MHYLQIYDRGTDVLAAVFTLESADPYIQAKFRQNGWGDNAANDYLFLMKLTPNVEVHYDPFAWGNGRTMSVAHHELTRLFHLYGMEFIRTVQAIDVEFVCAETSVPRERISVR